MHWQLEPLNRRKNKMKAVILDMSSSRRNLEGETSFNHIDSRIVNKPLMVHHIEALKAQGISDISVITPHKLPAELRDGNRWGVELRVEPKLDPARIVSDDAWIILPGNYLFSFKSEESKPASAHPVEELGWSLLRDEAEFFAPLRLSLLRLLETQNQRSPLTPQQLINLIERQDEVEVQRYTDVQVFNASDHKSLWASSQELLNQDWSKSDLPGYPLRDGIWVDVDTRVDESCTANGFVLIGKSSRIHRDVRLRGLVVIGDNVVIDSGTVLENTVVMDNTYIGKDMTVKEAVVDQNLLFRADLDAAMVLEDSFLLDSTR